MFLRLQQVSVPLKSINIFHILTRPHNVRQQAGVYTPIQCLAVNYIRFELGDVDSENCSVAKALGATSLNVLLVSFIILQSLSLFDEANLLQYSCSTPNSFVGKRGTNFCNTLYLYILIFIDLVEIDLFNF